MSQAYDLQKFVDAQDPVFEHVLSELQAGYKQRHWMWFVFPQLQGLGSSSMARRFGISSQEEAAEYLAHSILGPRLIECTRLVNAVSGRNAEEIFGATDAMKFRSSMTLFSRAAGSDSVFMEALDKYFGGLPDRSTLERL